MEIKYKEKLYNSASAPDVLELLGVVMVDLATLQAEKEQLVDSLQDMVESYDLLVSANVPLSLNPVALGVVRGVFLAGPSNARKLIQKYKK